MYLLNDDRFRAASGRASVSFPAQAGYRYVIDCSVAFASSLDVAHSVPGQVETSTRMSPTAGLVTVVTAPVTQAGAAAVTLRALQSEGAFWDWYGCEVTPLRVNR